MLVALGLFGGERTALGVEVENLRGAVLGLQQGQVDVQAGMAALIGGLRGMAAPVAGLQHAAVRLWREASASRVVDHCRISWSW